MATKPPRTKKGRPLARDGSSKSLGRPGYCAAEFAALFAAPADMAAELAAELAAEAAASAGAAMAAVLAAVAEASAELAAALAASAAAVSFFWQAATERAATAAPATSRILVVLEVILWCPFGRCPKRRPWPNDPRAELIVSEN